VIEERRSEPIRRTLGPLAPFFLDSVDIIKSSR
jgi:hypothetical protein